VQLTICEALEAGSVSEALSGELSMRWLRGRASIPDLGHQAVSSAPIDRVNPRSDRLRSGDPSSRRPIQNPLFESAQLYSL
jgi:hypothetical protein